MVEPVDGVDYISAWETNRGCPFQCTFCDWGSATKTKVRKWERDRLFKEIEWFADNKIPYIDCCDANFGIFVERDLEGCSKRMPKSNWPSRRDKSLRTNRLRRREGRMRRKTRRRENKKRMKLKWIDS